MDGQTTASAELNVTPAIEQDAGSSSAVVEDVLVEEVSIDGMCGVY